jgi:hypothetical protein
MLQPFPEVHKRQKGISHYRVPASSMGNPVVKVKVAVRLKTLTMLRADDGSVKVKNVVFHVHISFDDVQ